MNNLYRKIYKAINEGVIKSLHIDDENNDKVTYSYSKANNYLDPLLPEFIDLGLPSGTLWCTHNLGATCEDTPESWYGNYYAWGEIKSKNEYSQKTYKYLDDKNEILYKYNIKPEKGKVDNLTTLLPEDDVAHIEYSKIQNSKMAKKIKMPTKEQCEELYEYTNNKQIINYKEINGLNGWIFIGSNDNSIFIPTAGFFNGSELKYVGSDCNLWSTSLFFDDPCNAWYFNIYSNNIDTSDSGRCLGLSVRGVYSKN